MTWEIVIGLSVLVGFGISVSTPIVKLNTSITRLNCSIDALNKNMDTASRRIDAHGRQLDDLEHRVTRLEAGKGGEHRDFSV